MKRSWFGLGLLMLLLAVSLLSSWAMLAIHQPISRDLEQAGEVTLLGQFPEGRALAVRARAGWEKWAHFRACFSDHTPVEEIDAAFAELFSYGAAGEDAAFAAACSQLAQQVKAVGEAHGIYWWNLF